MMLRARLSSFVLVIQFTPTELCTAPTVASPDTKVIDSRLIAEGQQIRRRRECPSCNERFTTFETAETFNATSN